MNAKKMSQNVSELRRSVFKKMAWKRLYLNKWINLSDIRRSFTNKDTTLQLIPFQENNSVMDDNANVVVLLCCLYDTLLQAFFIIIIYLEWLNGSMQPIIENKSLVRFLGYANICSMFSRVISREISNMILMIL
jgi:hypothetical protein